MRLCRTRSRTAGLQPLHRLLRVRRQRPMRQDLQILLIVRQRLTRIAGFLQALRQPKICQRVVRFIDQRFLVPFQRGVIVLTLEVKVSHFDILGGFVRIPGAEFLYIRSGVLCINHRRPALGMVLLIVTRRTQINASVFAGAFFRGASVVFGALSLGLGWRGIVLL